MEDDLKFTHKAAECWNELITPLGRPTSERGTKEGQLLGPQPGALLQFFFGAGFPYTRTDYRKKSGTLILTSLLKDLD